MAAHPGSRLQQTGDQPRATISSGAGALATGGTLLILLLARLPIVWSGHIREDAFIYFRTAQHFASAFDLSYNLGERTLGQVFGAQVPRFFLLGSTSDYYLFESKERATLPCKGSDQFETH